MQKREMLFLNISTCSIKCRLVTFIILKKELMHEMICKIKLLAVLRFQENILDVKNWSLYYFRRWIKVTTFQRPMYKALLWLTKYITVVSTMPSMDNRRCIISCEMSIKPQIMNILPSECHQVLFQLHKL